MQYTTEIGSNYNFQDSQGSVETYLRCGGESLEYTRVYPAKGRPGNRSTKLDSGAQKRVRRSHIEGYGPRPQASTQLARAKVGQRAGVHANWDGRPLRSPALVARADFLKIGYFAQFSQFLH